VFSPVYGKYTLGGDGIVYFDAFVSVGAGLRFANTTQPFGVVGLGTSHYLFGKNFSMVPELRLRAYSEKRTQNTFVLEWALQLGVAWLF